MAPICNDGLLPCQLFSPALMQLFILKNPDDFNPRWLHPCAFPIVTLVFIPQTIISQNFLRLQLQTTVQLRSDNRLLLSLLGQQSDW